MGGVVEEGREAKRRPTAAATTTKVMTRVLLCAVRITSQINDPAPVASNMKLPRHRGVRCICLFGSAGLAKVAHFPSEAHRVEHANAVGHTRVTIDVDCPRRWALKPVVNVNIILPP